MIFVPLPTILQPHYEKVARLFNGPDAVHPGIILMTRVDCALKVFILSSEYLQSVTSWNSAVKIPVSSIAYIFLTSIMLGFKMQLESLCTC